MEALLTLRRNYHPGAALANTGWVGRGRKQEPGSEACVAQPMRGLDEVWRSWHSWQGLPSLALPCQGPTPPHHTTPQVKWRHACHSYPPPTPPLVLLSQPTKYRSFVFPCVLSDLSLKEQNYCCHFTPLMSTNLLHIHP